MPTFDWAAFWQRIVGWIKAFIAIRLIMKAFETLFTMFRTPIFLVALYAALLYFPDTIQWIFLKIGEIQIRAFMLLLSVVMPDVFTFGSGEVATWSQIWSQGLGALPSEVTEVMNAVGLAEMLGLVTSTLTAGFSIVVYRKVMTRAGLL